MKKHAYKVTVESLAASGVEEAPGQLSFIAPCHEDILALAARVGADNDKKLRLLVGLKLLGEVLLEDKENPLYGEFLPHFGNFMRALKEAGRQ